MSKDDDATDRFVGQALDMAIERDDESTEKGAASSGASTFRKSDRRTITHKSYWTQNKTRHAQPSPQGGDGR